MMWIVDWLELALLLGLFPLYGLLFRMLWLETKEMKMRLRSQEAERDEE